MTLYACPPHMFYERGKSTDTEIEENTVHMYTKFLRHKLSLDKFSNVKCCGDIFNFRISSRSKRGRRQ